MPLQTQVTLQLLWWTTRSRISERSWRDDDGMTTETVIITAVLAALALAATAIIVAKVTTKANNINVGGGTGG
jgi:hypothetical protein